ncbi:MAG: HPr family phosphocarrier protein [Butyricicoccaceae bacterium]
MKQEEIILRRPVRFHARPAGVVANEAQKFESDISLVTEDRTVNAKRSVSLMILGACSKLAVVADGPDEEAAVEAIKNVLMTVSGW